MIYQILNITFLTVLYNIEIRQIITLCYLYILHVTNVEENTKIFK